MFKNLLKSNDELNREDGYLSWYDLSFNDAKKLEEEFASNDMGKNALDAMRICVVIGIVTFVMCSFMIEFLMFTNSVNPYIFTILVILVLLGALIVVAATIEYHSKFNSWLKVKHKIIKK